MPTRWIFIILCLPAAIFAQPTAVPSRSPVYEIIDRLAIKTGIKGPFHAEIREYSRPDVARYSSQLDSLNRAGDVVLSRRDSADLLYLIRDNPDFGPDSVARRRGIWGTFYRHPAAFFEVRTPSFRLLVNPVFNFHGGKSTEEDRTLFANQRGVELRGDIDRRVYFYSNFLETQQRFADYVDTRIRSFYTVPGANFYKNYSIGFLSGPGAYDYNVANAYVGFNATRHIAIQFGHGKHFIGNGYRSMLLSDFGAFTFYLKFSTRVWKLHYQNLFLELTPTTSRNNPGDDLLPKKYTAIHYLSYNIRPNLSIGIFEATVFNRSKNFEFQYLNPVVFYRTVEGFIGSPDNVILGLNLRWDAFRQLQFYGQFLLDEFNSKFIFNPEQPGWWGNKVGAQVGLKYINAFSIDHLDLQFEYNLARPYTYAHFDSTNSYTHYNQPLAHPLWANFKETVAIMRYQPLAKLALETRWIHAITGDDGPKENWGTNPLLSYNTREKEFYNKIGQGIAATTNIFALDISYQIYHNLFFDAKVLYRKKASANPLLSQTTQVISAGIRMNLFTQNLDF